ncbi:MAG: IS1380 family transposase [Phycisphaerales bacterium]|nr:MAG: IS1380 family transposase [Phycisphaerales bacterium]
MQFDREVKLEFRGAAITSDAGLLPVRELDEAFRLTEKGSSVLPDPRQGKNTHHTMLAMLRQGVYGRLAGYEDVNDAEGLRIDPAMRRIVGGRANEKEAASTSEMSRFETEILSSRDNLTALMDLSGAWIDLVQVCMPLDKLILDMDSSQSETYGDREGSAYNGYFECTCYHPLFLFNQYGDLERAMLRRGNHASAKFWRRVLVPVIERYGDRDIPKYFRGGAAFAIPALYRLLEEESSLYAIRIPGNDVLMSNIDHLLIRSVGRPSYKPKVFYENVSYQAQTWDHPRRVVANVEWHEGELFPRVGFIVTNMTGWSRKVVTFYNGRGTAEQWIKEGKYAVKWTRLSCRSFKDNQARLQLFALAYNLGNFLRRLVLPKSVKHWSLTTLREKLIKIGTKVVRHAKYVTFQLAEVAVPRELFVAILDRIQRFGVPPPLVQRG